MDEKKYLIKIVQYIDGNWIDLYEIISEVPEITVKILSEKIFDTFSNATAFPLTMIGTPTNKVIFSIQNGPIKIITVK